MKCFKINYKISIFKGFLFIASLMNHPFFSLSTLFIIVLFLLGAHRRVVAPSIFVQRTREVLYDFAMDCDDTGKLILRPRPATA